MEDQEVETLQEPLRKGVFLGLRRAVVKVGSGVLTERAGLNMAILEGLSAEISALRNRGVEIVLVSSGAIASGLRKMGFSRKPPSLSEQQALAAIGQASLMKFWEEAFERHHQKVAQVLLTREDLTHRTRYLNARNTLLTLLGWKIVPIINENDTVAVDEIKFGDNDNLSAMVTNLTESQVLVNLTNIDGLYDRDPRNDPGARLIRLVDRVDRKVSRYASAIPGTLGRGGMASKVKAARKVALAGVPTVIANGLKPGILTRVFQGEEEGTFFQATASPLCHKKHWIVFTKSPKGELVIDRGAEKAILAQGKSLLASGIKQVRGRFNVGNAVVLLNLQNEPIAVGVSNYHSGDILKIMGLRSSEIEGVLGYKREDEVIHRDNLVLKDVLEGGEDLCPWKSLS